MDQVARYKARISGPLLDRIDIRLEVPTVPIEELQRRGQGDSSEVVRMRVQTARGLMIQRQGKPNAMLESSDIERHCALDGSGLNMLQRAIAKLGLSARSYHRTIKVARSIADLAGSERTESAHIAEALGYRRRLDGLP